MELNMLNLMERLSSSPVCIGVHVALSSVFCDVFYIIFCLCPVFIICDDVCYYLISSQSCLNVDGGTFMYTYVIQCTHLI